MSAERGKTAVNEDRPVDFNNPTALEEELKALEEAPEKEAAKKTKVKKPRKPRIVTCPECNHSFELPKASKGGGRGILAGIKVEDMTDDQLKIEYRNAKSVHYKQAKAKGTPTPEAQARLDKVVEIMTERGVAPTARASTKVDAETIANLIKTGEISVDEIQALLDA